jgi:hypothetical protein
MVAGRLAQQAVEAVLARETDQIVAWQSHVEGGTRTEDPAVTRFPLQRVLEESRALVDGTSRLTRWRVHMLETMEGVLGL